MELQKRTEIDCSQWKQMQKYKKQKAKMEWWLGSVMMKLQNRTEIRIPADANVPILRSFCWKLNTKIGKRQYKNKKTKFKKETKIDPVLFTPCCQCGVACWKTATMQTDKINAECVKNGISTSWGGESLKMWKLMHCSKTRRNPPLTPERFSEGEAWVKSWGWSEILRDFLMLWVLHHETRGLEGWGVQKTVFHLWRASI